jgi:prepilin-type N-terminal cleavage/methylation domain-containing protein
LHRDLGILFTPLPSMSNPPSPRLYPAAHGYSLIELLAVMAILSALAGLTVGSLSPVKANALTAGGNQIADLLASARENSISRHAFTAVVIKSAGDARYSAHCLFELTRNDDGNFADWKMLAPWRLLPDGIRFDNSESSNFLTIANSRKGIAKEELPRSISFHGKPIDLTSTSDVRVQIFQPDGTLAGEKLLRLRLVEAAEDTGPGIIYTGRRLTDGQPASYYDIVILRETGRQKVERL